MHRSRSPVALAALALTLPLLVHAAPATADPGSARVGLHVDAQGRTVHADGTDLVMRGVSHPHAWYIDRTPTALADIAGLGADTVRLVLASGDRWERTDEGQVADLVARCADLDLVCMLEVHDTTGYGEDPEAATLDQAVDYWIGVHSALQGAEDHIIVNIGNEPYGNDEATNQGWADDTSAAVMRLRAAGFDHMLVVDAPNWGQDWQGIMRASAPEVAAADPHGNTVFSIHMYGVYAQESTVVSYLEHFTDAGLPLVIGEFGHLHSDGDPDEDAVMAHADRLGLGYIGWSWSGNSGGVEYLDMVEEFDVDRLTPWGERIFHGPHGIATGG
ncbi:glycoside hydrolase family 5 protein [Nocardiopsis sp. MG754419]|uniref:glycoside hydrolase family 5 protein n=1 Tax=Nocardiopsis sp. MG754419 TaxID=2259865 RepID=UPI001BA53338|nr:glycoside hydrolase family 5 protein [Nocardiopsis sp. MG754419]MBR8741962.1 glycoside hydrolase family 5 protein [Nocardiopsis sp. MG754419]